MANTPGTVCHLEIKVSDLERAKTFYGAVWGWQFQDFGPNYALTQLGSGCSVGVEEVESVPPDGPHLPYVEVEGINETLEVVKAAGGEVLEGATEIAGGLGFYGVFRDPSGNRFGIHKGLS